MWSFDNIKKGPITTIVGIALMLGSIYVYLSVPNSEVFAMALLAAGAGAFGLRDPKLPGPGAAALVLLVAFAASGCVTYSKCFDKFGHIAKDSIKVPVQVIVHDTIRHIIPADTAQGTINDSLINILKRSYKDTIREESNSGKLQIKFWYDKYRHELEYRATTKPDTIVKIVNDTVRTVADCPPAVVFDPLDKLPWWNPAKLWQGFQFFAAWALIAAVLGAIVYSKLRTR